MKYDVIVIGAGASGVMSAITAARQNKSVLLLEKENKIGKKIYATGNGKCNFTNDYMKKECFFGNEELINNMFDNFSKQDTINFFNELGILSYEKNGYYYPNSNQASSIVTALELELMRLGVDICLNSIISFVTLQKSDNKYIVTGKTLQFENSDSKNKKKKNDIIINEILFKHESSNLIFSTGLLASPKLGSDGSIFKIIKNLNHTFTPIAPVLCGFYCKGNAFKKMAGVRIKSKISIIDKNNVKREDTGEIQITEYGISGIPVFQVSHCISELLLKKQNVIGQIDFLPDFPSDKLRDLLLANIKILPEKKEFKYILNGILPDKLWNEVFNNVNLDSSFTKKGIKKRELPFDEFINNMIDKLEKSIKHYSITIEKSRGYEFSQACLGGINSNEINTKTLESKIYKNLYFTGELLDVDGICGGYNLQWAWASGYIVGKNIK